MNVRRQTLVKLGAILLATIVVLTAFVAPQNSSATKGSTYGRSPDGYSAWFAFMADRGTPVERWQKPISEVSQKYDASQITFLRIYPEINSFSSFDSKALGRNNRVVILGEKQNPTPASFESTYINDLGAIKIETTRRKSGDVESAILKDKFGAIVWSEKLEDSNLIYSTTPFLAANAYQDFSGNYELLAKLVTEGDRKVVVDEYIHGYKDVETIAKETGTGLLKYLTKTSLLPIFIQGGILLLLAVIANNFRFGRAATIESVKVDNSAAYIQALGSVLQKAKTASFVAETIGKAERQKLQRKLGLGEMSIDDRELISAWKKQTGKPTDRLQEVLAMESSQRPVKEQDLIDWLAKWQEINRAIADEV